MRKSLSENFQGKIWYVSCPSDTTVLLAFDVQVNERTVQWLDTVKDRVMAYEKLLDTDNNHFVFERAHGEGGGVYTFVPLTLSLFQERVKEHILIPQDFESEEKLFAALQETRKNIW